MKNRSLWVLAIVAVVITVVGLDKTIVGKLSTLAIVQELPIRTKQFRLVLQ